MCLSPNQSIMVAREMSCSDHLSWHHMPSPITGDGLNFNEYHELKVGVGFSQRKSVFCYQNRGKNFPQKFFITHNLSYKSNSGIKENQV